MWGICTRMANMTSDLWETSTILKQAGHPWASQKVADDFWCVNISISVQSINVLMKWVGRSFPLPDSWLWSCLEGHSLFLFKIRYTSYCIVLHLLMDIQFKARSSSKQAPLKFLHSGPLSWCSNSPDLFLQVYTTPNADVGKSVVQQLKETILIANWDNCSSLTM